MEKNMEARMKLVVTRKGGLCFKWTAPGTRGVPDRIVFVPDGDSYRVYFIETKFNGNTLRPGQRAVQAMLKKINVHVRNIINSEQLEAFLNEI